MNADCITIEFPHKEKSIREKWEPRKSRKEINRVRKSPLIKSFRWIWHKHTEGRDFRVNAKAKPGTILRSSLQTQENRDKQTLWTLPESRLCSVDTNKVAGARSISIEWGKSQNRRAIVPPGQFCSAFVQNDRFKPWNKMVRLKQGTKISLWLAEAANGTTGQEASKKPEQDDTEEPDPTPCREHVRVFWAPRNAEQCRLSRLQRNPIRS